MSSHTRVLVFAATFNEASNIDEWISRVSATLSEADILIVDDSSPDGTGRIVQSAASSNQQITLIERSEKLGLGSAHKLAFEYALEHGYDALITMDADLSHEPESTTDLLRALESFDFVIGTRWGRGRCEYSGPRKALSWGGNWLARRLLNAPVSEYTTSFRAFTPRALEVVVNNPPEDDGYSFFLEVVVDLYRSGVSMTDVPITFRDRAGGYSKIPKSQIFTSSMQLFRKAFETFLEERGR